jgi:hypothetical protein
MKVQTTPSRFLARAGRIDAGYHLAPGQLAAARLESARAAGIPTRKLGGEGGLARVWSPNRFKRAYAAPGEKSVPYLRPYDVFNYLPEPADQLSERRTEKLASYQLKRGTILQTCSGRNLGPAVLVDAWLERFVLSHDMIRVEIDDERTRLYALAFLQSDAGQELLRRDMTGSVIDHLSDRHVADQVIPVFGAIIGDVVETMSEAVRLRESARVAAAAAIDELQRRLPSLSRATALCQGWTARSLSLSQTGRLDAAFFDPLVWHIRKELLSIGGVRIDSVAEVVRFKRFTRKYTTSAEHGRPMVSSGQLLETRPINLQKILPESFGDVKDYELRAGWVAYMADGRVEESLGTPVVITEDRDGWLANEHVGRIIPREGTDPGRLWLSLKVSQVQLQIKATASGSVVDATFPPDIEQVVIPPADMVDGSVANRAWDQFRRANELEARAGRMIDAALAGYSATEVTASHRKSAAPRRRP